MPRSWSPAVDPIPLSALEHYCYCPRQSALILVDGRWRDNEHTVRGQRGHLRVDTGPSRTERGRRVLRHLTLWSERLGLTGRADVIEVWENGLVPVEYKIGVRHGIAAHVQLCAQAMCLEEMFGVRVVRGGLWFASQRRRVDVVIDAALRNTTLEVIVAVHQLRAASQLPAAVDDERCSQCQLRAECMPGVVKRPDALRRYMTAEVWSCGS